MNVPAKIGDFLPQSLEAEQALLGAVLLNNDAWMAAGDLEPEQFFEGLHSELWRVISERVGRGEKVTPVTLAATLGPHAKIDLGGIDIAKYLARLCAEATTVINAPEFAHSIREMWTRRRLIDLARQIQERAVGGFEDIGIEAILDEAEGDLSSIRFGKQVNGVGRIGEFVERSVGQTAAAFQLDSKIGFDTGIAALDEMIGPIMGGDLITLLGASGAGKSALAAQILFRNAERGDPAAYFSQEMAGSQVARRVLASHTGISTRAQRSGEVNQSEYEALQDASTALKKVPLYLDESGRQTTSRIVKKMRAMKKLYGIKLAAIDHLLLIRPEHSRMNKFETIENAAIELKDAAKDLDMAVILLAQRTREAQKRETWKVTDQDLWGGDIVKQCSDVFLTVSIPEKWFRQHEPKKSDQDAWDQWVRDCMEWQDKAFLTAPKVRDGDDSQVRRVGFDGPRTLFFDI